MWPPVLTLFFRRFRRDLACRFDAVRPAVSTRYGRGFDGGFDEVWPAVSKLYGCGSATVTAVQVRFHEVRLSSYE